MKKKTKSGARSKLEKLQRQHAVRSIPDLVEKIEKMEGKLSRMRLKVERERMVLLTLVRVLGGIP